MILLFDSSLILPFDSACETLPTLHAARSECMLVLHASLIFYYTPASVYFENFTRTIDSTMMPTLFDSFCSDVALNSIDNASPPCLTKIAFTQVYDCYFVGSYHRQFDAAVMATVALATNHPVMVVHEQSVTSDVAILLGCMRWFGLRMLPTLTAYTVNLIV